ncbi:MAG: amidase [Deltaproteobacteria bacterium]|nr:amidase [Deltaproteobacteria bacterium]
MATTPENPLRLKRFSQFAKDLRAGKTSCRKATTSYLERISALDPKLQSYVHIDADNATSTAIKLDQQLQDGSDPSPLLGLPVAVKDIITVKGMPTKVGSRLNVEDLIQPEGSFISRLKSAGCVILGKTRTIEFAAGAHNISHPTPWNPTYPDTHHAPGGSSSGSAVAQAAGLCAFAIGTDTGGSVRVPAALCSLFGFKPSKGLWPMDGVFPVCQDLDTIGLITSSAADAAFVFSVLSSVPCPQALPSLTEIRLGIPDNHYFENLDPEVRDGFKVAVSRLKAAGVVFESIELPEAEEAASGFAGLVPYDLIQTLGQDRFLAARKIIDPTAFQRLSPALDLTEEATMLVRDRLQKLQGLGAQRLEGLDGFISPTTPLLPRPVTSCSSLKQAADFTARVLQNSRPANIYNLCAASVPIRHLPENRPVGLQVQMVSGKDADVLSLAQGIELLL